MQEQDKYTSLRVSDKPCEGERFGPDGIPQERCEDTPVFELSHSSGRKLHVCEYHIEMYWNLWQSFRTAVRDIWPVKQAVSR